MAKEIRKPVVVSTENIFPVVGIGASAGGLEAFKDLIRAIPKDMGMAFILVQHLSPKYESVLSEILQKVSNIPVVEIIDNIKIIPNHIYVIPSNRILTANDGVLILNEINVAEERSDTVNIFFTSLAEVHREHTIGVVLSGTGADGTVGLKAIKDLGGITIVQDSITAAYYGMPQSALDADVVDFVLPPDQIPNQLMELVQKSKIIIPDLNLKEELKEDEIYKQILAFIRIKRGVDFAYYKQTTIQRRILRRKALNKLETLKDYHNYLLNNKEEQVALFNDILIPVTAFFRDPNAFSELEQTIIPLIFKSKSIDDVIRIWVAGCSTGEEAYSIGICFQDYLERTGIHRTVQIFASDISELVISKARSGCYQKKDLAGVSAERLKKYFTKNDGNYFVNRKIREMCVFASQNFLKDPPFAKLDIISCRNVLIYMEPYLQKKAVSTFHYALNPGGFLILGKSESIGTLNELFTVFNQTEKIYSRKSGVGRFMQVFSEKNETEIKQKDILLKNKANKNDDFYKSADEVLLSKYPGASIIINEQMDVLQTRGKTNLYLQIPSGKTSLNLFKMVKDELSFELRNVINKAKSRKKPVKKEGISVDTKNRKVNIEIIPLPNTIDTYYLILLEEFNDPHEKTKATKKKYSKNEKNPEQIRIEQLEHELFQTKQEIRSIAENQEAANEELQSANEELLSGSEELQSLNEELETTKEEIQSNNEELTTMNEELVERNEQLIRARKYSEAIVTTIHEPLIILTREFIIKSSNKSFYEKFGITEQQTEGKSLFEISNKILNLPELKENLQKILVSSSFFEGLELKIGSEKLKENIFKLNARQIINENSNEQLILLAIQDITDQKLFEQNLEQQVLERTKEVKQKIIELQRSNENLQQFATIASHDLQEPLRKIITFSFMLNNNWSEHVPSEGKNIIDKIKLSADRMSQLIKDVLQYSRVINVKKEFKETDLNTILMNVLDDLDLLISETSTTITYKKPFPLIESIPLQMNQLFYNLITNSIKFRKNDIPSLITISHRFLKPDEIDIYPDLSKDINYVEMKFMDNGIGFESQFSEQIFQMFERLHSIDEFEGTGIGLSVCKQIVENHHGHINATSSVNKGASFVIILPVRQIE